MKKGLAFLLFLISTQALCEYRVYQYYVRTKIQNLTPVSAELVTSTLDPISYVAYHGGSDSIEVSLLRSWQCMGNTSKLPPCTISEGKELRP
ncbi:MAG: hypothetical protein ACXVLQ_01895 [Bacteriovorax sp.]